MVCVDAAQGTEEMLCDLLVPLVGRQRRLAAGQSEVFAADRFHDDGFFDAQATIAAIQITLHCVCINGKRYGTAVA